MNKIKKVYLINFDKPLDESVIEEIKSHYTDIDELNVLNEKVSINFQKPLYIQCVDIRKKIESENKEIFSGNYPIIVNLPGLSIAALYLVNEIEAILREKPKILELIRNKGKDKLFTSFEFKRIFDLDYNKNVSRNFVKQEKKPETSDEK